MADLPLVQIVRRLRRLAAAPDGREKTDGQLLHAFAAGKDAAAFEALVERYGALVFGVCRKVLQHEQDAEDAFQATFAVLARRAGSLRRHGNLTGWLYGVAYRVSIQARRNAVRRRTHEARALPPAVGEPRLLLAWQEVQVILAEEIERLPERYRTPFVLCVVHGQGRAEIARLLEIKEGTLWSRLAHARGRLQARLARRGVELGAVVAATYLATDTGRAAVPAETLTATVRKAALAAGARANLSPEVDALARHALRSTPALKVWTGLALFIAGISGIVTGALALQARPGDTPASANAGGGAEPVAEEKQGGHTDRYGDPLPEGALARAGTLRLRAGFCVFEAQFLPDGKSLILAGAGSGISRGGLALWDVDTGRKLRQFPLAARSARVQALLSPDGKVLASGESDVTLWDVAGGDRLGRPGTGFVASLAFTADGKMLAVGTDKGVALCDVAGRKVIRRIDHPGYVAAVAFTPDGKALLSAGYDKTVRQWDPSGGKEIRRWQTVASWGGRHHVLRAEPSGQRVAYADDESIRLLDTRSGEEVRLAGPGFVQNATLAFSRDGKSLASGDGVGSIRLWDPATGNETARWKSPGQPVYSLAFTPDGKVLVSTCFTGSGVQWWDVATGEELPRKWAGHGGPVNKIRFSADGRELYSLGADGSFFRWDTSAGVARGSCDVPITPDTAISPDGKETLSAESILNLQYRDTGTGRATRSLRGAGVAQRIAFSGDGKSLAFVSGRSGISEICVWDSDTGKRRHRFTEPIGSIYSDLVFSTDGKKVAAASRNDAGPHFHLWDLETGKKVSSCDPDHGVNSIAFSPDGERVALGSSGDRTRGVSIWNLSGAGTQVVFVFPAVVNDVAVAFSPTGRYLAAGGSSIGAGITETPGQNTIYVLETATGRPAATFPGNHSGVMALAFAPDGRTLASGGGDSTILIWDLIGRRRHPLPSPGPPTRAELDALWQDLAAADGTRAYRAIGDLVCGADASVSYLKSHLTAVPRATAAEVRRAERLAADLDSNAFATRQKAAEELGKISVAAAPVLRKLLATGPGAETRRRIESLLGDFEAGEAAGRLRGSRALETLELLATPQARNLLQELAAGEPDAWLTREAVAARERLKRTGK